MVLAGAMVIEDHQCVPGLHDGELQKFRGIAITSMIMFRMGMYFHHNRTDPQRMMPCENTSHGKFQLLVWNKNH